MLYRLHFFPGLTLLLLSAAIQLQLSWWALKRGQRSGRARLIWLALANMAAGAIFVLGYLLEFHRVSRRFSMPFATWEQAAALVAEVGLIGFFCGLAVLRRASAVRPERRAFVKAAGGALIAAPYVCTAFGIIKRDQFQLKTVDVAIPNLPPDLQGLRLTQVTDIHLSPFLSEREFARAVDMANATKAHVMLVTGDLITRRGDPLEACLRQLARLRGEAGVLGCLGNHEDYCGIRDYVTKRGRLIGIDFLRSRARLLRFGEARLNIAGVDYQKFHKPYLVGAEKMIELDAVNIMLSHNPDVFPVAASQGYDLTIAGHTHGGQVNVEILRSEWNAARFFTPYTQGLYRQGNRAVYVCSGIGTIGVPVRIGAPAEVTVLRLCAI